MSLQRQWWSQKLPKNHRHHKPITGSSPHLLNKDVKRGYDSARLKQYVRVNRQGCWVWQRSMNGSGYGVAIHQGKHWLAHRLSAVIHKIANHRHIEHNVVLHDCDNPRCINPKHLTIGTQKQNVQDMKKKGRWHPLNTRNNNHK